eukprot:symbB.v1.2.016183.t1/scaffold1227.1/size245474/10
MGGFGSGTNLSNQGPPRHRAHLAPANHCRYDRVQCLRIFDDSLQDLRNRGQQLPINAEEVLEEMQQRHNDFHLDDTPFNGLSDLLDAAVQEGWIEASGRRNVITRARLSAMWFRT